MTATASRGYAGEPLIEVRGLRVDYGAGPGVVHAVVDADLTLLSGTVMGLAGESGSGKSTLAYAMTRLLRAPGMITGGEVWLHGSSQHGSSQHGGDGQSSIHNGALGDDPARRLDLLAADETQLRELRWSRIAVVLQSAMHALNPVMSVGVQLTDVLRAHMPGLDRAERRARAGRLLEMVGIGADRLSSYPHQLSGGMRQRVMIAMALALEPAVVIMDEPTTALDVVTQREILQELTELQQQLSFAVLFITHDLSLLVEFSDRIAIMYGGRIVEQAPAKEIYTDSYHPYSAGLLGSFPALRGPKRELTGIPGSPPDLRAMPTGCAFHPRCPKSFEPCATDLPVLGPPDVTGGSDREVACWLHPVR